MSAASEGHAAREELEVATELEDRRVNVENPELEEPTANPARLGRPGPQALPAQRDRPEEARQENRGRQEILAHQGSRRARRLLPGRRRRARLAARSHRPSLRPSRPVRSRSRLVTRGDRLRRLIQRDPQKYFWPAVVEVMLELGWKPPTMTDRQMERLLDDLGASTLAKLELSPTETRLIQLFADGRQRNEIAAELGVSEETIKTYLKKAYARLGARNAAHAVAIGFRNGILK